MELKIFSIIKLFSCTNWFFRLSVYAVITWYSIILCTQTLLGSGIRRQRHSQWNNREFTNSVVLTIKTLGQDILKDNTTFVFWSAFSFRHWNHRLEPKRPVHVFSWTSTAYTLGGKSNWTYILLSEVCRWRTFMREILWVWIGSE